MSLAEANLPAAIDADASVPFPNALPLTDFELFMLLDDRASHPMNFFIHLEFEGQIDRAAFERALAAALFRQPMLRSHSEKVKGKYFWKLVSDPPLPLVWTDPENLYAADFQPIELGREIGLRVRAAGRANRTEVLFEFHHACVDGLAGFRFIGDVLTAYDAAFHSQWPPAWREVDYQRLANRGYWPPPADAPPFGPRVLWFIVREVAKFMWRRPSRLASSAASPSENRIAIPLNRMWHHRFSLAESNAIRAAAGRAQVTVNDLLLCAMFLALDKWNTRCGDRRGRKYLRINMPTSVDERFRELMPACNQMSLAFLTRRRRQCQDPQALLQGIRVETGLIKRWNLGSFFLDGLKTVNRVKGWLSWLLSLRRGCFATAVLSNVGDLSKRLFPNSRRKEEIVSGNLTLQNIYGAPPVRQNTGMSVAVMSYGRQLSATARFDAETFVEPEVQELFDLYTGEIVQLTKAIESQTAGTLLRGGANETGRET